MFDIYKISKSCVKPKIIRDLFPIKRGARQGDPLSPKLFTAVLGSVFGRLNWEDYGLKINCNRLNHLRFADDPGILESDPKILQEMVETLA